MANWKKVLVSGSEISVAGITSSQVPSGTSGDDVVVLGANGEFKKVTQTSIQGVTTANFTIEDSAGTTDTFDATSDTLIIDGDNASTTTVTNSGTETTITVKLPPDTVSGSAQITLDQTIGYTAFSSSLASRIADNSSSFGNNENALNIVDGLIDNLVLTSSELLAASTSMASLINTANTDITSLEASIEALELFTGSVVTNDETGSFLLSESIVGTENEITITGDGDGGITVGLPNDVTIGGRLEAGKLVINGETVSDNAASTVEGNTIQGNASTDIHRFTGSLQITGALEVKNGSNDIFFAETLSTDSTATVDDIIVRRNSDGKLGLIGNAVKAGISGSFTNVSASIASDIAGLDTTATTNNSNAIDALELTSGSLEASASVGIYFSASEGGSSIGLGQSASFVAAGDGLTVAYEANGNNGIVTYTVDPEALGGAIGAYSSSAQLQTVLDSIYVPYSDVPISGAEQLQTLGFITSSTFDNLDGVPVGIISGADNGTVQGQVLINDEPITIFGLGTGNSPTFNNVTITNNLTVKGPTTAIETTELNIEDQFILINSGAGAEAADMDGGIIVDSGNGSGALLMYKKAYGAWAFAGSTDPESAGIDYDRQSTGDTPVVPDVIVATVDNSQQNPSDAPDYGTGDYKKGQMHINTQDSTIWIYV